MARRLGSAHPGSAETRWIVDPLDGTKGFTRGRGFWGPLVALEHRGDVVAGAMALPALGETYWAAKRLGAWMRRGESAPVRLQRLGELRGVERAPPRSRAARPGRALTQMERCRG